MITKPKKHCQRRMGGRKVMDSERRSTGQCGGQEKKMGTREDEKRMDGGKKEKGEMK